MSSPPLKKTKKSTSRSSSNSRRAASNVAGPASNVAGHASNVAGPASNVVAVAANIAREADNIELSYLERFQIPVLENLIFETLPLEEITRLNASIATREMVIRNIRVIVNKNRHFNKNKYSKELQFFLINSEPYKDKNNAKLYELFIIGLRIIHINKLTRNFFYEFPPIRATKYPGYSPKFKIPARFPTSIPREDVLNILFKTFDTIDKASTGYINAYTISETYTKEVIDSSTSSYTKGHLTEMQKHMYILFKDLIVELTVANLNFLNQQSNADAIFLP